MAEAAAEDRGRGRRADRPGEIPKPGWRDILLRTWKAMGTDHVSMIAAGVGFYVLLAIFPAITAIISIWGLVFDPLAITKQIATVSHMLPQQAGAIIEEQAAAIAEGAGAASFAALAGIGLALYSAMKGVKSLIEGMNIIYDEEEARGFVKLNLIAALLTLAMVGMMICMLGMLVVYPAVVGLLGISGVMETLVNFLRFPLLAIVAVLGLMILYRYGPSRDKPRWRWVNWGAIVATVIWVVGSIGFSIYIRNFGSYNETYGTLGAAIVMMMWFWLSAFIVLMGAELNSEIEHQTARDSTTGGRQPMGERAAHVADTVGESP